MVSGNNMTRNYEGMEFHFSKDGVVNIMSKGQKEQGKFFLMDGTLILEMPKTGDLSVLTGRWEFDKDLNSFTLYDERMNPAKTFRFNRILREAPGSDKPLGAGEDQI